MDERTIEEIAGSKARKMSPEMRMVLEAQRALLKCKTPGDLEIVFAEVEKKINHQVGYVDRIGLMLQSLLMMQSGQDAYNDAVDFFLKLAAPARKELEAMEAENAKNS